MNKNHIDILLAGSSEMITKYDRLSTYSVTEDDAQFYDKIMEHWMGVYKRAIIKARLDKDT